MPDYPGCPVKKAIKWASTISECLTWAGTDGSSNAGAVQPVQRPASSSVQLSSGGDVQTSSHFMPYFITITVVVVMLYVVYHKRNLVMTDCTEYYNWFVSVDCKLYLYFMFMTIFMFYIKCRPMSLKSSIVLCYKINKLT